MEDEEEHSNDSANADLNFTDDMEGYWRNPDEGEDRALIDTISNSLSTVKTKERRTHKRRVKPTGKPQVQSSDQVPTDTNTVNDDNIIQGVKENTNLLSEDMEPELNEELKEESIKAELKQLFSKKVFDTIKIGDVAEMSIHVKIIDSLMFTKCKYNANGVFTKWKSRLAARGDQQDASAYGGETSSPTANMTTINLILNFAVQNKYEIFTSDVPGAYLHADLEELVIMRLPRSCTKF